MATWDTKVKPRTAMRGMPAQAYNKFIDAAKWVEDQQATREGGQVQQSADDPRRLDVINSSIGGQLEAKTIVGFGDIVADATTYPLAYANQFAFDIETPSEEDHGFKWGVLEDAIDGSDKMGVAITYGLARVKIDMQDSAHKYATIDDGNADNLISTDDASKAPIWYVESGTGVKEGVVFVRPFGSPATAFEITELGSASSISASAADVSVDNIAYSSWVPLTPQEIINSFSMYIYDAGSATFRNLVASVSGFGLNADVDVVADVVFQMANAAGAVIAESVTVSAASFQSWSIRGHTRSNGEIAGGQFAYNGFLENQVSVLSPDTMTQFRVKCRFTNAGPGTVNFVLSAVNGVRFGYSEVTLGSTF